MTAVKIVIVSPWHMRQPGHRDPLDGPTALWWVRLGAPLSSPLDDVSRG